MHMLATFQPRTRHHSCGVLVCKVQNDTMLRQIMADVMLAHDCMVLMPRRIDEANGHRWIEVWADTDKEEDTCARHVLRMIRERREDA